MQDVQQHSNFSPHRRLVSSQALPQRQQQISSCLRQQLLRPPFLHMQKQQQIFQCQQLLRLPLPLILIPLPSLSLLKLFSLYPNHPSILIHSLSPVYRSVPGHSPSPTLFSLLLLMIPFHCLLLLPPPPLPPPSFLYNPTKKAVKSKASHAEELISLTDNKVPTMFAVRLRKTSCSRNNFGVNLIRGLFTEEVRATSNIAGKKNKAKLDEIVVKVVREAVFDFWPLEAGENEEQEWGNVVKAIDEANRRLKRTKK